MTGYTKTMTTAFGLSAAAHIVGAVTIFTFFAGYAPQLPIANKTEVAKLTIIEIPPPPPPKYEPPKVIPPAPIERKTTPPRVETPPLSRAPAVPIAAPTNAQLASTAPVAPISSLSSGVQVTLQPAQPDYYYNPKPRYPREAKNHGWQGTTLLRVEVQSDGDPKQIEIAQSSGFSILDDASVEAVRSWKFVPARLGDRTVAGTVEVPITFKLVTN